ncbi:MAG: substrate-binding domain-containing protein [Planctomycetaceae bacterium]|nr:substrate-binding domain-containing protein [Planctomycetaceae bacterium]
MLRFTRSFACFSLLLLLPLLTSGCLSSSTEEEGGETKRFIILTNGNSPYWDAAAKGAQDAAQELKLTDSGYQLEIQRGDYQSKNQIDKLKSYLTAGDIAGVAISVVDDQTPAIAEQMKALRDAGIKVVTIDSDVNRERNRDARFGYIGTDNEIAGAELGKAAQALVKMGNYSAFVGLKGASNAQARIKGFEKGAGSGITQKKYIEDGGADKAPGVIRNNVDFNSPPDLLVGIWSYNTPAIVQTVEALKIREKVKVIGFDADPPSIKAMKDGQVDALLVQDPYQMGFLGVKALKALVEDDKEAIKETFPKLGEAEGDIHTTGLKVVVPNKDSKITKDLFNAETEFLTLSEFEEWLKKYGLTGS